MKKELITTLTDNFELHAQQTKSEIEYCFARDLQHLLGYDIMGELLENHFKSKNCF